MNLDLPRSLWVLPLALSACDSRNLADHPVRTPVVQVTTAADVPLDAVMPSDAVLRDDGTVLVLDGYGGRVLAVDPGAGSVATFADHVGRGVRLAPAAAGGWWITRPGAGDEGGTLLRLDAAGAEVGAVALLAADGTQLRPVDVLALDPGTLLVADRSGSVVRVGADGIETGRLPALRRVVDLVPRADGFVTVDGLAQRVTAWSADGVAGDEFGRPGLAVGTLSRPTSAAEVAGGWLVADAVLGAVQAFDPDGSSIGGLGEGDLVTPFGHPTAVRTNPALPGRVVVLEARPARLRILQLGGPLPAAGPAPLLRTTLVAAADDPAGESGESCAQCHDGLILDSRQLWDGARKHHPVNVVPKKVVPAFFPLDDDGRVTCRTCHSPHGVVEDASGEASGRVRHASQDSPFLRLDRAGDALCTACHGTDVHAEPDPDARRVRTGEGHLAGAALSRALEKRGASEVQLGRSRCLSCHATHGAAGEPLLRAADDAAVCVGCHAPQRDPSRNHVLGRVPGRDLLAETRGSPVRLSTAGGVECLSCHSLTSGAPALLRPVPGGPVCLECHADRSELVEGPHGKLARGGSPACVRCHDVHGGERAASFVTTGPATPADPRGCLSCHADHRGATPGRAGHPVTGAPLPAPQDGHEVLDCLACHDPHRADRPTSEGCPACHADQGAAHAAGGHGSAACLDCHPAHRPAPAGPRGENPAASRCLACHAPDRAAGGAPPIAAWKHPAPTFLPDGSRWTPLAGLLLYGPDGQPVPTGANGELVCETCHVVHGPEGRTDHLRRARGWQAACAACHGDDGLVFYQNFHAPDTRASLTEPHR